MAVGFLRVGPERRMADMAPAAGRRAPFNDDQIRQGGEGIAGWKTLYYTKNNPQGHGRLWQVSMEAGGEEIPVPVLESVNMGRSGP